MSCKDVLTWLDRRIAASVLASRWHAHCNDVIISAMASQITSLPIVYSTVYSRRRSKKHQSSSTLAFVRGMTGEFPAQRANNGKNVSIWWRHHVSSHCWPLDPSPWDSPHIGAAMRSFDVFFPACQNKPLNNVEIPFIWDTMTLCDITVIRFVLSHFRSRLLSLSISDRQLWESTTLLVAWVTSFPRSRFTR